jgi:hypothetical protein
MLVPLHTSQSLFDKTTPTELYDCRFCSQVDGLLMPVGSMCFLSRLSRLQVLFRSRFSYYVFRSP